MFFYLSAAIGFVVLTLVCWGAVLSIFHKAWQRLDAAQDLSKAKSRTLMLGMAMLVWATLQSLLASSGLYADFSALPPRFIFVLGPGLGLLFFILSRKKFSGLLAHVSGRDLIALQAFRLPVELLLWLLHKGDLIPVQMSFEGRNWDILVGITAIPIAFGVYPSQGMARKWLGLCWNVMGLALLLNIVITAILSMPTPFRYFLNEPANTIVATFPFILLPACLVMLAFYLHGFSIKKLLQERRAVNKS